VTEDFGSGKGIEGPVLPPAGLCPGQVYHFFSSGFYPFYSGFLENRQFFAQAGKPVLPEQWIEAYQDFRSPSRAPSSQWQYWS
jgi:hypothetical protein